MKRSKTEPPFNHYTSRRKKRGETGLSNQRLGIWAEREAGLFLMDQGLQLLAWRSRNRNSEVDWIGLEKLRPPVFQSEEKRIPMIDSGFENRHRGDGKSLVFFEIKYCRTLSEGLSRVNSKKLQKLKNHCEWFVQRYPQFANLEKKIEVLVGVKKSGRKQIEWNRIPLEFDT